MFARLAFACAISLDFDILLVDEILSVGDTSFQNKCINKMKELTEQGKTIIYVSHDLHSIKYFCDEVIRLDNGKIIEQGTNVMEIVERYEKNITLIEENQVEMIFSNDSDVVTINKVSILDKDGKEVTKVRHQDKMSIRIEYEMHNYQEGMFFGVGMRNSKGEYVNGMNTKQGNFKIEQTPGKYILDLVYEKPYIYKDVYTLWGVSYNSTGTVVLSDYIIKDAFEVYVEKDTCEGVTYIEHEWKYSKKEE